MGGGGGSTPQRNLGQELRDEINARADTAGQVFGTEAEYWPQYVDLNMRTLQRTLEGTPGGERTINYSDNVGGWLNRSTGEWVEGNKPDYGSYTVANPGRNGNPLSGLGSRTIDPWVQQQRQVDQSRTVMDEASPGLYDLLDQLAKRTAQSEAGGLSIQREADIADVQRLGPQSLEAIRTADPAMAELVDLQTQQAAQGLRLGTRLSPEEQRGIQNSVRGRQAQSGWGYNPGDLATVAMETTAAGRDIQDRRRQYAATTTGLRQGIYGDAFNRVLNRPAGFNTGQTVNQAYGISGSSGPRLFGPSVNANDVYDTNINAQAARQNANANANAAYTSAGISGGLGLAAAGIIAA